MATRLAPRSCADARSLFEDAADSDRLYFSLAARTEPLAGAELAWIPGLSHLPGAVVLQGICAASVARGGTAMLERVEQRLEALGTPIARLYLQDRSAAAEAILLEAGYHERHELIFAGEAHAEPLDGLTLHAITTDSQWVRKKAFHEQTDERPDGHPCAASDWVEMERRKCAAGGMIAYYAEIGGEMVGVCGALPGARLTRVKNIAVHPAHRRRRIGSQMLALAARAVAGERLPICIYAVAGEAGELLYRAAGLVELGSVVEWSKPLIASEA